MPDRFRVRRNPDGSLSHVGLGSGPPRSMYPDGNTIDDAEARRRFTEALLRLGQKVRQVYVDEPIHVAPALAGEPLSRYLYGTRDRGQLVETEIVR